MPRAVATAILGGGGDTADEFVLGAWVLGTPGTAETPVVDVAFSDWEPVDPPANAGNTYTQTRVKTTTTTTHTPRTDTRICSVTINGSEDDPPLDCATQETSRTVNHTPEPVVVTETLTQEVDNAIDTAAWVNTTGADPVETQAKTITAWTFDDDDALTFQTGGSIDFTVTGDETFDLGAGTITQNQTCTLMVNGLADTTPPTCAGGSAIDDTRNFQTGTLNPATGQTAEDVSYAFTGLANPLSYTDAEITNNAFRVAANGYDIVNFDNADKRFLITNIGRGSFAGFAGAIGGSGNFVCYNYNGDTDCDDSGEVSVSVLGTANAYTAILPSTTQVLGAEVWSVHFLATARYVGLDTSIQAFAENATDISQASKDILGGLAPGATVIATGNSGNVSHYLQVSPGTAHDASNFVTVNDYGACGSVAGCDTVANDATVQVSATDTDAEIVDDLYVTASIVSLLYDKYEGLSGDQIEAILLETRNADKSPNLLDALSPVGNLR